MSPNKVLGPLTCSVAAFAAGRMEPTEWTAVEVRVTALEQRVGELEERASLAQGTEPVAPLDAGLALIQQFEERVMRAELSAETFREVDRRGQELAERGWSALVFNVSSEAYASMIVEVLDGTWPEVAQKARRIGGREVRKIAGRASMATSPYGSIVQGLRERLVFWLGGAAPGADVVAAVRERLADWESSHGARLREKLETGTAACQAMLAAELVSVSGALPLAEPEEDPTPAIGARRP